MTTVMIKTKTKTKITITILMQQTDTARTYEEKKTVKDCRP